MNSSNDNQRFKTLEAIHDEAVDAIIIINDSGIIDSVNPATETLFGYSNIEMIGNNVKMLMPNPFRDAHDGYLGNYRNSGHRKIIGIGREVVGQKKNGTHFPIHLAVSEIKVGENRSFAGVIRDLTNFKKLEERETTLGRIIENSLNEIFIFSEDTLRIIQANRGACENSGFDIDEIKRMTFADVMFKFSESDLRTVVQPIQQGRLDKLNFETELKRKDGSSYYAEVHLQPAVYRDTNVYVAIILDITRRRQAEQEVERQRKATQAELEQLVETRTAELRATQEELVQSEKFSTLGKVSGGIAHEIRNPLSAVKTSAYYLLNATQPTPEKVREHLERIDRQVTLIDNVVTALTDVAKLPAANLQPVDLKPVVLAAVQSTNLPDDIEIRYQFPDDLPKVLVDENQISIAVKNLIRNGRDAMADAGGVMTISAEIDGNQIVFHFADTGVGIPPENLKRILEPLFTTKARGMGLGLSITKAIVDKNECRLAITSETGQGSTFSIGLKRHDID